MATIAIDLDEVLSPFIPDMRVWYNQRYQANLELAHFISYDFTQVWGGSVEQAVAICDEFHQSRYTQEILPLAGAVAAISELKQAYQLVLVTSRPLAHANYTHAWVNQHFPDTFSEVILCNHWTSGGEIIKKSTACQRVGAKYLIDDLATYVEDVAEQGMQGLLFGDYPWNQQVKPHANIQRLQGWREVAEYFSNIT